MRSPFKMKPRGGVRSNPYSGLMKRGLVSDSPLYQATKTQAELKAEAKLKAEADAKKNLEKAKPTVTSTYHPSGNIASITTSGTSTGEGDAFTGELATKEEYAKIQASDSYKRRKAEELAALNYSNTEYFDDVVTNEVQKKANVEKKNISTKIVEGSVDKGEKSQVVSGPKEVELYVNPRSQYVPPVYDDYSYTNKKQGTDYQNRVSADENDAWDTTQYSTTGDEDIIANAVIDQANASAKIKEETTGDKTTVVDKSATQQKGPIFQRRHNTVTTSPIKQVTYDKDGYAINNNEVAVDESQKGVEVRYFKTNEEAGWKDKTAEKEGTTPHVRVSKEK